MLNKCLLTSRKLHRIKDFKNLFIISEASAVEIPVEELLL